MHVTLQGDAWLLDVQFSVLQGFWQKRSTVTLLDSFLDETPTTVSSFKCPGVFPNVCLPTLMKDNLFVCQPTLMKDSICSAVSQHFLTLLMCLASSQRAAPLL